MQTITAEQFKQKYGDSGVASFNQTQTPAKQGYIENLTNAVGGDLANRMDRFAAIQNDPNRNIVEKGVQMFGQGAGLAANTLEQTVLQAPGIKQVAGKIGEGMNWITTSNLSPIKHLGDVIGSSKTLQAAVKLYDTNPRFKDTVDALGNTVRLGGDIQTMVQSANFAANVTNKVIQEVKDTATSLAETGKLKLAKTTENTPANIMNRVARLNPTDEIKFTEMSGGKTPGQYLADTGNFNEPRKLIINEANKFATSKASVDTELAKLPGVYQTGAIDDVLTGLQEKVQSTSGTNIKSPYAGTVADLVAKNADTGLTMEEINTAKRLYERYVKTGYNKIMNADKVEQATNIDSALRTWQVEEANKLGFTNIAEMNKQTQLAKFIVDKLGNKIIGQSGLNGINLTDWIVLSGGDPKAVAGFLVKKFLSSKSVQSKIAEIMNQKDIQGLITPETSITPENINRRVSPQGLKGLPAPEPNLPSSQNFVPIESFPKFTQEGQTSSGFLSSFNKKTGDWYIKDIKTGKLVIIPSKLAKLLIPKKLLEKSSLSNISQLAQEARKYKNVEEFVKAQGDYFHGTSDKIEGKLGDKTKGIWLAEDPNVANKYISGGKSGAKGEIYYVKPTTQLKIKDVYQKGEFSNFNELTPELENKLMKKGYDGIRINDAVRYENNFGNLDKQYHPSVRIFADSKNKLQSLTKSQLTDIWNKANKK